MQTEWDEFCAQCTFMRPSIECTEYFSVETTNGTEIIPAGIVGRTRGGLQVQFWPAIAKVTL